MDNITYLIHTKKEGNKILTKEQIIKNAMEQEADGIKPNYIKAVGNYRSPAGWLVWSTFEDGCGMVYKINGQYILATGWQGDFIIGA